MSPMSPGPPRRLPEGLVPLRIPPGWAVLFNNFVELPPYEEMTPEDADAYLSDDLLSIAAVRYGPDGWGTDPAGAAIDLGWTPAADVGGRYTLTALVGGWDEPIAVFQHRDRDLVRRAIDAALGALLPGAPVDRVLPLWRALAPEDEWRA